MDRYTINRLDQDLHERLRLKKAREMLTVPALFGEQQAPWCKGECPKPRILVQLTDTGDGLTCCHFHMARVQLEDATRREAILKKQIETGRHQLSGVLDDQARRRMEELRGTTSLKESYRRTYTGTARLRALSLAKVKGLMPDEVDEGESPATPAVTPKDHPKHS